MEQRMQYSAPRPGVERTYTYTPGGIQIACADLDLPVIVEMAKRTGWTFFSEPGARSSTIRPEICAVLDDLEELRSLSSGVASDCEARQDVLEADLEQHLYHLRMNHHRVVLFGAYRGQARADLTRDIPFIDAVRRDGAQHDRRSACLAMVVVPSRVRSCTIVFNPAAQR
jgi:hypothetical protein